MFNLPQVIPKEWIETSDNALLKITNKLRTIDSKIGELEQIEDLLPFKSNTANYLRQGFNEINRVKQRAVSIYNTIKQIMGEDKLLSTNLQMSNAVLGGIPILVTSTNFNYKNTITEYTTINNKVFSDNIYNENYSIELEFVIYGRELFEMLKKIVEMSRKREPISFSYDKLGATYEPLAVQSLNYKEDYTVQNAYIVNMQLQEINIVEKNNNLYSNAPSNMFIGNNEIITKELKAIDHNIKITSPKKTVKQNKKINKLNSKGTNLNIVTVRTISELWRAKRKYNNNKNVKIVFLGNRDIARELGYNGYEFKFISKSGVKK